jgi:4-carboxymuconolactone decarboxylase
MNANEKELYEQGLKVRREVLGSQHVDKSMSSADDFTRPLQEWLNIHCWGSVWPRSGLPRKTRSMINLALLAAFGRTTELKTHVRGAITNGVTKEEIAEVFLHAGTYCGAPVAVEGFRAAKEVFQELGI